ncbi:MAG: nucleotide exchange factor GrpE [Trueperaceae bacterium]|nr:nucleotide exchange factor GrpE [Trueperaceae bacterium]|tara:strand:- start:882 stop:1475 length:594 start_codon:yes stop_codon:yes gene_type:complete
MSKRDKENTNNVSQESVNPPSETEAEVTVNKGELSEIDILREELATLQASLATIESELSDANDRHLRARADLDNYRRRAAQDADRARQAGLDSAVLPILSVFDDLGRALAVADEEDPAKIIPGVQSVMAGLERNLDSLGLKRIGEIGEKFDPDLHEALTAVPTDDSEKKGTIAEVFQSGFVRDERLVRPARVLVFQE